jgi:hypothetical protein
MIELDDAKQKLGQLLESGKLIAFVGSGISAAEPSSLPTWGGFLMKLIDFCAKLPVDYSSEPDVVNTFTPTFIKDARFDAKDNPVRVATVLKEKVSSVASSLGRSITNDLNKWFHGMFINAIPNSRHDFIVNTNFPYILTTNYDTLLGEAQKTLGSPLKMYSFTDKVAILSAIYTKTPSIIHVHGMYTDIFQNSTFKDDASEVSTSLNNIVFTVKDYHDIIKKKHAGFSFGLQTLFLQYSTIFLGYGSNDPHLEDVLADMATFFGNAPKSSIPTCYLMVKRGEANSVYEHYKKMLHTELIVIDNFTQYDDLLNFLATNYPRKRP